MIPSRERLIVALDVSTSAAAQKIVAAVGDSAFTYKVGMQLYTAVGPQIVRDELVLVVDGRGSIGKESFHRPIDVLAEGIDFGNCRTR